MSRRQAYFSPSENKQQHTGKHKAEPDESHKPDFFLECDPCDDRCNNDRTAGNDRILHRCGQMNHRCEQEQISHAHANSIAGRDENGHPRIASDAKGRLPFRYLSSADELSHAEANERENELHHIAPNQKIVGRDRRLIDLMRLGNDAGSAVQEKYEKTQYVKKFMRALFFGIFRRKRKENERGDQNKQQYNY